MSEIPHTGAGEVSSMIEEHAVITIAQLSFGEGKVGLGHHLSGEAQATMLRALATHTHEAPAMSKIWLPIDCMDDREIVRLGADVTDTALLRRRRAFQLPGGGVLAATKAGLAAQIAMFKGITDIKAAYEKMYNAFQELGIPDGSHAGCGASTHVQNSVEKRITNSTVHDTLGILGVSYDGIGVDIETLETNKNRLLDAGVYASWSPEWHADFAQSRDLANFSWLYDAHDEVHGHTAAGVYVVADGHVFDKNGFVADSGVRQFALTFGAADALAHIFGGNEEERRLMSLAFRDDALQVTNHIVAPGLEVAA